MVKKLIYKQYYNSNTHTFLVLMRVKPSSILKFFLNFGDPELEYSYKLYSYKKGVYFHICKRYMRTLELIRKLLLQADQFQKPEFCFLTLYVLPTPKKSNIREFDSISCLLFSLFVYTTMNGGAVLQRDARITGTQTILRSINCLIVLITPTFRILPHLYGAGMH